jgi:hypothetical protein
MVSFLSLDLTDEDSINHVLANIDGAIQYGEDTEVKEPKDEQEDIADLPAATSFD